MKVLTNESFKSTLEQNERVLIDFYADWCGPCKMIAPTVEELDKELENVLVCKVNVDVSPELAVLYGVEYIPTIVYIKNGNLEGKTTGLKTKEEILAIIK